MARSSRGARRGGRRSQQASPFLLWGLPVILGGGLLVLGGAGVGVYYAWQGQMPLARSTPSTASTAPAPTVTTPTTPPVIPPPRVNPASQPRPDLLAPPPKESFPPDPEPYTPRPQPNTPRPPADDGYNSAAKERDFIPKNGMYTARMPAGERGVERRKLVPLGSKFTVPIEEAVVESGGTLYVAGSLGIPAVVMKEIPVEERCDMVAEGVLEKKGGKLISKKLIKQDKVAGKEYLFEMTDGAARVQVFTIAGWIVIALVEGKDLDAVRSKDVDTFLAGMKLSNEAKKVYADVTR